MYVSSVAGKSFAENRFLEENIETTKARESKGRHQQKHRKNCECYPGHSLTVSH